MCCPGNVVEKDFVHAVHGNAVLAVLATNLYDDPLMPVKVGPCQPPS